MSWKALTMKPSKFKLERRVLYGLGIPVVKNMGAWSDKSSVHSKAHIDIGGNLSSQLSISTWYNFSYVGSHRLFSQLNYLPIIETSLKSKLAKMLNKKYLWVLKQPFLFSWQNLSKLNSVRIGYELTFARLRTHEKKLDLNSYWDAPYMVMILHVKLPDLLQRGVLCGTHQLNLLDFQWWSDA
jgi:hypothetical protein